MESPTPVKMGTFSEYEKPKSPFYTGDMAAALDAGAVQPAKVDPAEAAALARQKGWTAPEKYDYERYNATGGAPPVEEELPAELIWGARAAKYEWKDEYGDVGPANPELEKMLFHNEFTNRRGHQFEKYASYPDFSVYRC